MAAKFASAVLLGISAAQNIPDQDWGMVDVRPGAHMFWWLYGSTALSPRAQTPIIMWLQGGPGGSSTGIGNFGELGPLGEDLKPRNSTWLQAANLLFLDQPVGTGYSYVDNPNLFVTNNTQIAADVVTLVQAFYKAYPSLTTTPFFIFCESYGGKMTTDIALALIAATEAGALTMNFKGVALGDSWINGASYVDAWGPYLYTLSMMDDRDLAEYTPISQACDAAVAAGDWTEAINQWGKAENAIDNMCDGVNFYNVLLQNDNVEITTSGHAKAAMKAPTHTMSDAALSLAAPGVRPEVLRSLYNRHIASRVSTPLDDLMNGPVKNTLNSGPKGVLIPANITWGGQSGAVFSALSNDFMRPVVEGIDALLAGGKINVTVYTGQLDLICCSTGTENWMKTLKWADLPAFNAVKKTPEYAFPGSVTGGFRKAYGPLTFWIILDAGHMVPNDNGAQALAMVQDTLARQA